MWHTEHWTAVSTLLGLISSVHRDLHHWRSNPQPQYTEVETLPLPISSKQLFSAPYVPCRCLPDFLDMVILRYIYIYIYIYERTMNMFPFHVSLRYLSLSVTNIKKKLISRKLYFFFFLSRVHFFSQAWKSSYWRQIFRWNSEKNIIYKVFQKFILNCPERNGYRRLVNEILSEITWKLRVQSQQQVDNKEYLL